jgi:hypothetical protein
MERVFSLANLFAMVGWLLLIAAPHWRWTGRLVLSGWWSLALAGLYTALVALYLSGAAGGFGSIAEVRELFASDALLTAGWVHYLAFDLYVGALLVQQAHNARVSHLIVVPMLIATFLLGPVGLLAWFVVKSVRTGRAASITGTSAVIDPDGDR